MQKKKPTNRKNLAKLTEQIESLAKEVKTLQQIVGVQSTALFGDVNQTDDAYANRGVLGLVEKIDEINLTFLNLLKQKGVFTDEEFVDENAKVITEIARKKINLDLAKDGRQINEGEVTKESVVYFSAKAYKNGERSEQDDVRNYGVSMEDYENKHEILKEISAIFLKNKVKAGDAFQDAIMVDGDKIRYEFKIDMIADKIKSEKKELPVVNNEEKK